MIVFAAGGLGCTARYMVSRVVGVREFPYATLAVNLVGCLLIAFVSETTLKIVSANPEARLALVTGFLGGFTTYSSFNYETTRLALGDSPWRAAVNLGVTVVGCALMGLVGLWLAKRV